MTMAKNLCNDRVVGAILASWRYDISGISPEMRRDYEQHLAECSRCSSRQRFHRGLDVTLLVLTGLSVFFSVFALAVLMHIKPLEHVAVNMLGLDMFDMYHMLVSAAIAGVCFSVIAFALVAMATPAPTYLSGIAAARAKLLEERLPDALKSLRLR
jgi:Flp pilus assembly protein TadB